MLIFTGAASQAATASFLTDALGGDGGQFDSIITATRNAIGASAVSFCRVHSVLNL